jgi:hypothetical protein
MFNGKKGGVELGEQGGPGLGAGRGGIFLGNFKKCV